MTETHDSPPEPSPEPELFVEFANRLKLSPSETPSVDADLAVLRGWLDARGLMKQRASDERLARDLPRFRELRGLVRGIAARVADGKAPTRAHVTAINRILREGVHYHALRPAGRDHRFRMEPIGDELDQARSAVAGSLAHYLAEHDQQRLKVCADDTCSWLFIDESPAGRRRWCDMRTCGNRAKVARHRARARSATRSPTASAVVSQP